MSIAPSVVAKQPALDGAAERIAADATEFKLGAGDKLAVEATASGANGTVSVAYDRTYKGLEVFGGDFVVVTDAKGQVLNTSVAQKRTIKLPTLSPTISAERARSIATARFESVTDVGKPQKLVHALDAPRLAWKVAVGGIKDGGDAGEDVYIDARTGAVIDVTPTLMVGTGRGFHSGPSPLPLRTSKPSTRYALDDPQVSGLHCGYYGTPSPATGTDDDWGTGDGTVKETGCADALYAAQNFDQMLREWLGRNGPKGNGQSWPVYVGWGQANAAYCSRSASCDGRNEVWIGRDSNSNWVSSLDVVAHEFGHGVDDYTPGGYSRKGTAEFVADVFGTLSEQFDNQSNPYDAPDYLIGEETALAGGGGFRDMANPSAKGAASCYSSAVDTMAVHKASGPGDHWFYLLAEGSNPTDGNPTSTTCDGSRVTGVGIQKAAAIFYNAILMKTTDSSYQNYRRWTLQAAKNLYPDSCTEFDRVKAAWNAVSVPAVSGEPTCTAPSGGYSPAPPFSTPTTPTDPEPANPTPTPAQQVSMPQMQSTQPTTRPSAPHTPGQASSTPAQPGTASPAKRTAWTRGATQRRVQAQRRERELVSLSRRAARTVAELITRALRS